MDVNYNTFSLDMAGLEYGRPPVPLLPKVLRDLWKNEELPAWLVQEGRLPAAATIEMFGASYWAGRSAKPSERVRHFVEFLIRSRRRAIGDLRTTGGAWPAGLKVSDIPFGTRSFNALRDSGLLERPQELAEITFGLLSKVPNVGVRTVLEITALMETAFEIHNTVTAQVAEGIHQRGASGSTDTSPAELHSQHLSAQLGDVLGESWADQIDEGDLRFVDLLPLGRGSIEERVEQAVADPTSPAITRLIDSIPKLRAAIQRLDTQPIERSLVGLLDAYERGNQRRIDALVSRLGWSGDEPKTLQECGDELGVTRERIRQIEAKFLRRLGNRQLYLPQLDSAIELLEGAVPIPIGDAAQLLKRHGISERPFSPIALISTAQILGRKTGLRIEDHAGQKMVVSGDQADVFDALSRISRKLTGQSGVASVYQVADSLREAESEKTSCDETDIRKILQNQDEYEFLDEDWFWNPGLPDGRNRLENIIKKVLSVAAPQSVSSLREAVRRAFQWRISTNSRYRSLSVPPQFVLTKFLERHPDFVLNGEMVSSARGLDYQQILGQGEQALVEVLRGSATGILDRRTLVEECLRRGINENTLSLYSTYSPVLEHAGLNLWQLRGVRIDPAVLEAAREQNAARPREMRMQDYGWLPDGKLWISWTLPTLSASPVFGIPSAVKRYVAGRAFTAKPKDIDREVGRIGINAEGSSYGYGTFLRYAGADRGDVMRAEFDLAQNSVQLSTGAGLVFDDE